MAESAAARRSDMANVRVVGPRIEAADAKAMVDAGDAIVLDVVASHVWPAMARIIPDSIHISPEQIQERFGELPRNKTIIAYCT